MEKEKVLSILRSKLLPYAQENNDAIRSAMNAVEDVERLRAEKRARCKWILYDYKTIAPQEHELENPYWRIPENYREVLKYCPYCGKKIDYFEIEAEIEKRGNENEVN